MRRIPTLDGWRGIAILLVMFTHAQLGLFHSLFENLLIGKHGVGIFFVLSGYLISSKLLEQDAIDLKGFYIRRFSRLMPCVWTYLAFLVLLGMVIRIRLIGSDLWSSLFFFRNYFPTRDSDSVALTSQFWSLSIEEQFYLVWPAVLLFCGRKKAFIFAAIGVVGVAAYRFTHWDAYNNFHFDTRTEVNLDGILLGCILAYAMRSEAVRSWFERNARWALAITIPTIIWCTARFHYLVPLTENIAVALALGCTSARTDLLFSRFLEWGPLKTLGVMSYSVYVWQEIFLVTHTGVIGMALLPFAAILSYHYIEQPGIRLGRSIISAERPTQKYAAVPSRGGGDCRRGPSTL